MSCVVTGCKEEVSGSSVVPQSVAGAQPGDQAAQHSGSVLTRFLGAVLAENFVD